MVVTHTDFNGRITTYTYDSANRVLTKVPDPSLSETTVKYTYSQDKRYQMTDASGTTTYDGNGNVLTHTDFNGRITTYTYDSANRVLTKVPDPSLSETTVKYTYSQDKRYQMIDASGTTTYYYTQGNRLNQKSSPVGSITLTYDKAGNLTSLSGGANVNYTYDALDRLSSVSEPQ